MGIIKERLFLFFVSETEIHGFLGKTNIDLTECTSDKCTEIY